MQKPLPAKQKKLIQTWRENQAQIQYFYNYLEFISQLRQLTDTNLTTHFRASKIPSFPKDFLSKRPACGKSMTGMRRNEGKRGLLFVLVIGDFWSSKHSLSSSTWVFNIQQNKQNKTGLQKSGHGELSIPPPPATSSACLLSAWASSAKQHLPSPAGTPPPCPPSPSCPQQGLP